MHRKLAEEFEADGDLKSAEEHYWQAGDGAAAVAMYRDAEQWADAYRCAKRNADERGDGKGAEQKQANIFNQKQKKPPHFSFQVLYMWAKSIGGDAAVKLLMRYEILYEAIDISLTKGFFFPFLTVLWFLTILVTLNLLLICAVLALASGCRKHNKNMRNIWRMKAIWTRPRSCI